MFKAIVLGLSVSAPLGCAGVGVSRSAQAADYVVLGASIHTMDSTKPHAEALEAK